MAAKILDASALGALLFGEPDAEAVAARLAGASLVAPALLLFEFGNVCLKKLRRHPDRRDALLAAFADFARLAIDIAEVDPGAVLRLAEACDLTFYDASYLWLARRLDAELVTLDRQLAGAAAP